MTLLRAGGTYWFLYEGTPGGALELEKDYVMLSDGTVRPVTEDWAHDLPDPEWVAFGDRQTSRMLYVALHEDDPHPDQFWQMRGEMVVFGFGREYHCCGTYLTATPSRFTVGLAADSTFEGLRRSLDNAVRPLQVRMRRVPSDKVF